MGWLHGHFETDSSKATDLLYRDWNGEKVTDALPL
jgi:hypothetical protein